MLLGTNNQDIMILYNALLTLTKRSERIQKDKLKLQSELLDTEDQINSLDDSDKHSY